MRYLADGTALVSRHRHHPNKQTLTMEGYDAEIFVPSEFKETTFDFDGIQQRLYCSHAATTDYDLTGQIVWPASQVLAWYLRQTKTVVEGKHVVEVGAGCGLVGGVAKQCGAASVTLTDGSPHVVDLLKRTHALNRDVTSLTYYPH